MYIDQRNISHIVTKLWWEGNKLFGNVETANTLAGRDMRGLVLQGSKVAFSMRGMSDNVRNDGRYQRVGSPLMITAYDWVVLPSHENSYMVSENTEAKSYSVDERVLQEGVLTPYNSGSFLEELVAQSRNVSEMTTAYGFDLQEAYNRNDVELDLNSKELAIKEGNETLKVFLEESLKADLDDYYKDLTEGTSVQSTGQSFSLIESLKSFLDD